MSRMYTNYLNGGKRGFTWAALVATTLGAYDSGNEWYTNRQVAELIAGPNPTPAIIAQVNTSLNKLVEENFVAFRYVKGGTSSYQYRLTSKGLRYFEPPLKFVPSESTDSKLLNSED
jgi:hypothetical protein